MNSLLKSLAAACRKHLTGEKLLVVPSLSAGHQLLEQLSQSGTAWLNLRPVTVFELAEEVAAAALKAEGLSLPAGGEELFLIEETLQEMNAAGSLVYFAPLKDAGLARLLYPTLRDVRLAGLLAADLDPATFVDRQKGREIIAVLSGYEQKLTQNKRADQALIYRLALAALDGGHPGLRAVLLIPAELDLPKLPFQFLSWLDAVEKIILPHEAVLGLDRPSRFYFTAHSPGEEGPLSRLYFTGNCVLNRQTDAGPDIFRAYGPVNEIKEVIRRLKTAGIPLDSAMLLPAVSARYTPLLFSVCERLGLPVTFADGVPLCFTRPGRLALALVRWLEEKYASRLFCRLLQSGDLELSAPGPNARLLREAGIGWGRHRYLPRLEALASSLLLRSEAARVEEEGDWVGYHAARAAHAAALQEAMTTILARIPETFEADNRVMFDFPALCRGLAEIVDNFACCSGRLDSEAKKTMEETLLAAARACPGQLPEKQALRRLRETLERATAAASPPRPGHLHVASIEQAGFSCRPYTFVLGLAAGFPGPGLQDPVLLDSERRNISPALPLCANAPEQQTFRLALALASRRGRVTLSFPCFDPVEGRASFPAAVVLQAHRLSQGDSSLDYSSLLASLGPPAGYIPHPATALAEEEWWLATAFDGRYDTGRAAVLSCYPGFAAGLAAESARTGSDFTAYDGHISASAALDPRQSGRPVSATQFEKLAACPYAYFLRYVLGIEPPDETDYDPGAWLDPLTRGSLLHEVYCLYLRRAYPPNGTPAPDLPLLISLAEDAIARTRAEIPPPGEVVFEQEKEDLLRGLEVFYRVIEASAGRPLYQEVPFGFGAEEVRAAGLGLADPVVLALPGGGELKVRGRIDRIDRGDGDHTYEVWDFKTGGSYGYEERHHLRQGRQIQHALNAYAAEAILKETGLDPRARVESAGYIFPTEKGEGRQFGRSRSRRGLALEALEKGLNLLSAGLFCVTSDSGNCTYCQYALVCRSNEAVPRSEAKKETPDLTLWKELQQYD